MPDLAQTHIWPRFPDHTTVPSLAYILVALRTTQYLLFGSVLGIGGKQRTAIVISMLLSRVQIPVGNIR